MSRTEFTAEELTFRNLKGWYWVRTNHASLFDRGSADSYYHRAPSPHYGGMGGNSGVRVDVTDPEMVAEYLAGYQYNEEFGSKKEW